VLQQVQQGKDLQAVMDLQQPILIIHLAVVVVLVQLVKMVTPVQQ